ncbi:MAG: hypothetical protein ABSF91_00260 [Bacteroidota bacterium]
MQIRRVPVRFARGPPFPALRRRGDAGKAKVQPQYFQRVAAIARESLVASTKDLNK